VPGEELKNLNNKKAIDPFNKWTIKENGGPLKIPKIELPYDSVTPLLGIYLEESNPAY
jgi:hypothetical protein